eukprot:6879816-Pyramimonas_sp.AAC.1
MGSKDRSASAMHRRCGSMWNQSSPTLMAMMHRRRRRCIADALAMHWRCIGVVARPSDPIYSDPI